MRLCLLATVVALLGPATAAADSFVPVPRLDAHADQGLQIRFVRYTGGTNGEMVVEVKNTAKAARTFSAEGLYFVPDGDPESAPQRLGAAGPFELVDGDKRTTQERVVVAPGKTERLHLAVFCIDSHRSSPGASQRFSISKKRMPKALRHKISSGTKDVLRTYGNSKAAPAKSAIQSHVWKSRDEAWIQLEGERKNEKSTKPSKAFERRHPYPNPNPRQQQEAPQQREAPQQQH